jgi:hypothetical protein
VDVDIGDRRDRAIWRMEALGAVAVIIAGVLLHFVYDWSGGNRLLGAIAPVNESVWEHLKLVSTPLVVLGAVEAARVVDRRRLWWAKLVEVIAASVFIVTFFYTYTGALGVESNVAVDILSFLAAIAGGQWLSYRIIVSQRSRPAPLQVSITVLVVLVVGFAVLTFTPPHIPLFQDGVTGTYGPS